MTLFDISVAYGTGTPGWPGDTAYECGWAWAMGAGASVNVSRVTTSWHVGTHADAPLHVLPDGAPSESLPLAAFAGLVTVLDAADTGTTGQLERPWLSEALTGHVPERLLLRTGRSVASGHFPDAWPSLSADAVGWLVSGGIKLLGVDAPSVDARTATDLHVHRTLFAGGACVLENLRLDGVPDGTYLLSAYPVLVVGADAAPVRAVLKAVLR